MEGVPAMRRRWPRSRSPRHCSSCSSACSTRARNKALPYARALTTIGNETKDALTKLYEAQASALAGEVHRGTGRALKNAPALPEAAVKP